MLTPVVARIASNVAAIAITGHGDVNAVVVEDDHPQVVHNPVPEPEPSNLDHEGMPSGGASHPSGNAGAN
ncbi:hypothetical protein MKX03_005308 [Papaver bracteatum]|nr:hypothetical protein MKX03_005308 [Papaver bracteatum]